MLNPEIKTFTIKHKRVTVNKKYLKFNHTEYKTSIYISIGFDEFIDGKFYKFFSFINHEEETPIYDQETLKENLKDSERAIIKFYDNAINDFDKSNN